ncbi:MAG: MucR family transcriptional regulator [Rhodospirillaceae bacterium]|nr:MucR family transcriptional regulator [Rhodospirillaceae bacterium]MBT6118416.1 MucR family transcriptional regulator [Rhodospirillaceae bacterium]
MVCANESELRSEGPVRTEVELTVKIVSAYVSHAQLPIEGLEETIEAVHDSLCALGAAAEPAVPALTPAVPISASIRPDYLVCLENGRRFRSLKRHLRTAHGLTPEEYRARWGLPPDYPMVAPNYARLRSDLARTIGLGRRHGG